MFSFAFCSPLLQKDGWNGLVKVLIDNEADMVVTSFKITPNRSAYVDFSIPFQETGITIAVALREGKISHTAFLGEWREDLITLLTHAVQRVAYMLLPTVNLWHNPYHSLFFSDLLENAKPLFYLFRPGELAAHLISSLFGRVPVLARLSVSAENASEFSTYGRDGFALSILSSSLGSYFATQVCYARILRRT